MEGERQNRVYRFVVCICGGSSSTAGGCRGEKGKHGLLRKLADPVDKRTGRNMKKRTWQGRETDKKVRKMEISRSLSSEDFMEEG
ncbi:unnamed protein product [Protopolystoma xenopodis]|uniref:Uncharacterized protein n=1 Tax=Protopolystoma xenopodis TaxID=117903 RepID=A0A3S5CSB9_9PLAT|nr:unnamed protein product [Protopolystoma xenopodis]